MATVRVDSGTTSIKVPASNLLEQDELFKQIGGQLDASNFDYSQWQRSKASVSVPAKKALPAWKVGRPATVKSEFTVSSSPVSAIFLKKERKKRQLSTEEQQRKAELIKILKLRILARKQTIEEYQNRQAELYEENTQMRHKIEGKEENSHDAVKTLLRKYEKFRGGMSTLYDQFGKEVAKANKDVEQTRVKVEIGLASLLGQVSKVDEKLQDKIDELNILLNYKDKEYPEKALLISDLKKEIEGLSISHMEEENELTHVVDTELEKYRKEDHRVKMDITDNVTAHVLQKMHPSLKEMATQNTVMRKEMDFHKKEIKTLNEQISQLESDMKKLSKDPKSSIRQQLFPECFLERPKCTPDIDIVFDIPVQTWLPI